MKEHIRIVGVDDGPFDFSEERCLFAGVLMRLPDTVESMVVSHITVDGDDSSDTIAKIVRKKGWGRLAHAIMLDGASMGGFNLLDTEEIHRRTGVPTITVTHERPDMDSIRDAMKQHFTDWERRFEFLRSRALHEIAVKEGIVFASFSGIELKDAKAMIRKSILRGLTPEPVRLARILARAVKEYESG